MLTGVNLPEELIPEILYRLPAKSLGRFKCVSKPWKTLISDPKFIKTHLSQTNRLHRHSVIFAPIFRPLIVVDFEGYQFTNGRITSVLEFEQSNGWLAVCGSCDGLILALTGQYKLCLLNPTTRECKKLPSPNSSMVGVTSSGIYGLGYDSLTHDYKVVIFCKNFVWVYMLRSNCWKMVQNSPFYWLGSKILRSDVADAGVFVNGSVHLLCRKNWDSPVSIFAFDLADETFREVPPPCELTGETQLEVRVLGGFLCLTNSTTDIWVMREYGVKESWSRFSIYQPRGYHIRPVLLSGDEDFLLIMNKEKLVVYNVKEKTSRDINCHGLSVNGHFDVRTFAGSLVSPNQWD